MFSFCCREDLLLCYYSGHFGEGVGLSVCEVPNDHFVVPTNNAAMNNLRMPPVHVHTYPSEI